MRFGFTAHYLFLLLFFVATATSAVIGFFYIRGPAGFFLPLGTAALFLFVIMLMEGAAAVRRVRQSGASPLATLWRYPIVLFATGYLIYHTVELLLIYRG